MGGTSTSELLELEYKMHGFPEELMETGREVRKAHEKQRLLISS